MARLPRYDFSTPERCILFKIAEAIDTRRPFALSEAKALARPAGDPEPWDELISSYLKVDALRVFRRPPGGRGRRVKFYYPTCGPVTFRLKNGLIEPNFWGLEPMYPPNAGGLEELIDGVWTLRGGPPFDESGQTKKQQAPELPSESETHPPSPAPVVPPTTPPDDPASSQQAAPEPPASPAPIPAQNDSSSGLTQTPNPTEPEQVIGLFDPDMKAKAYSQMRQLIEKSIQDRGFGCTSHELRWRLEKAGFTPEQAFWYLRLLAGWSPEAYKAGGLKLEGPHSAKNRTDQPRYYLRSENAQLSQDMADWEALQYQQHVRGKPVKIESVL